MFPWQQLQSHGSIISPFEDAVQKKKVLDQTSIKFTFLCIVKQWKQVTNC